MENKKVVTASFLVLSLLGGFVLSILLGLLASMLTGATGRVFQGEMVQHAVPVVFGVGLFFFLQLNSKVRNWSEDVVAELKKVVWPSRPDTTRMTIVVCVMVVIAGLFLFTVDWASGQIIAMIVDINFKSLF